MCLPGVTVLNCLFSPAESRLVLLQMLNRDHRNIQKPARKVLPLLNLLDRLWFLFSNVPFFLPKPPDISFGLQNVFLFYVHRVQGCLWVPDISSACLFCCWSLDPYKSWYQFCPSWSFFMLWGYLQYLQHP